MPFDLTNTESVARQHAKRVGSPGYVLTPEEKTYNIYPEGLTGSTYEYFPTETGGQPDLRSITTYSGMMEEAMNSGKLGFGAEYGTSQWAKQEKEYYWQREYDKLRQSWMFADDSAEISGLSPDRKKILMAENFTEYQSNVQKLRGDVADMERKLKQIDEADGTMIDGRTAANARIKLLTQDMPIFPQMKQPDTMGTPFTVASLEKEVDWMHDRLKAASSWRPGKYNLTSDEAIETIKQFLPTAGWQFQKTSKKVQLFSALDTKLRFNKEIEWGDTESQKLAQEMGLLPRLPETVVKEQPTPEDIIKSLPAEFQEVWKRAKAEGISATEFLRELSE